jgi:hypothetical protein
VATPDEFRCARAAQVAIDGDKRVADLERDPDNPAARSFEKFLDVPDQVISESAPTLLVSLDLGRFAAATQSARAMVGTCRCAC